jgi:hypothetical protein
MTQAEYQKWQAEQERELFSPTPPAEAEPAKKKTIRFRARVPARLGKGGKPRDAIVTIDKTLTMRIRPFRGRKTYEMSMEQVVSWLMQKLVVGEIGKPRRRRL